MSHAQTHYRIIARLGKLVVAQGDWPLAWIPAVGTRLAIELPEERRYEVRVHFLIARPVEGVIQIVFKEVD